MSMESLGGRMPVGRPAAVFAGGKTHVFAIAAGGGMNHWSSADGTSWTGPDELPRGPVNLEPSYACAIAASGGVHVLAVNHNSNPFAHGGAIAHWFSPDGASFLAPILEQAWEIPGSGNGIAAAAPGGNAVEAFAVSGFNQLVRYSWSSGYSSTGAFPLPGPPPPASALPASAPAAAAAGGGVTEVFAVAADGNALRWRIVNGAPVAPSVLPRPPGAPAGPLFHSGLTAVSPAPGQVEVFAVAADGLLANWSIDGLTVTVAYRSGPMPLHDSVPVALMVGDHLEVFAIGRPPGPFAGGPLIRWRRDRVSGWSRAVTIGANLAAGGLGAAAGVNRVDAFGFNSGADNSLLHWPAGIAAAQHDGWANWGNNQQTPNPSGHCRPSTHEDVVAIVKTAEMVPGARVRAVGSSWSFSDIAVTPSFIVETRDITGVYTHVIDASVLTEQAPAANYLLHVGAGTVVEDLMLTLDLRGLAPFTLGGSSGQTIAGVVSTSVHGSDIDRGPIPHAVRALELVGPGGVQHWIEPDQWRITKEDQLRARLGPDVQIHYDDDWFDAALVSMGSMGIITSLVYEATDQYKLEKTCEEVRWRSVLRQRLLDETDFVGEHHSIMVAIDPAEMGDRTCYVTKRRDVPMSTATTPPSGSPDPLGALCEMNAEQALHQIGELVGIGVLVDVAVTTAQALGIPIPAIPPGVSTAVTISIIVAALKLGGPGAIGDFVGSLCNSNSEAAAALATWLTRDTLKPGQTFVDVAHKIMAPWDLGQCAARGLAIEVAFDVSAGGHIAFLDEAMAMLDMRRQDGMALGRGSVLGGYIALRFMGPSRAILSPQQSARTCTVEITGLRSLHSTAPLLDELEKLATKHGAIQHWGMFSVPNLSAADLVRAYPRLDTWRRVRREITSNGTIQTFENAFTARVGLDAPPAGVPLVWQQEWRWCSKCMGMAYGGGKPGPCPAGGNHDHSGSGNYGFSHNAPWTPGQREWRWCSKCMGMTFSGPGSARGPCPGGGNHDLGASGNYTLVKNGQAGWRACHKCQSLAFGAGQCPAGGAHDFRERHRPPIGPPSSATGDYWLTGVAPDTAGQPGWFWCDRCQSMTRGAGVCVGAAPHSQGKSGVYSLPLNAPNSPGQAHWRLCKRCQTLSFGGGACFAGGAHDLSGSGDYTLRQNAGQGEWRRCTQCQGLFFNGGGALGLCPSKARTHKPTSDEYFVPYGG
jgi:hypothetical protein